MNLSRMLRGAPIKQFLQTIFLFANNLFLSNFFFLQNLLLSGRREKNYEKLLELQKTLNNSNNKDRMKNSNRFGFRTFFLQFFNFCNLSNLFNFFIFSDTFFSPINSDRVLWFFDFLRCFDFAVDFRSSIK